MAKWTAADIPRQDGSAAVVIGANGGVGYAIALELARAGAHVVLACRDTRRGDEAAGRIAAEAPGADALDERGTWTIDDVHVDPYKKG